MNKIGVALLAHGDIHIDETISLLSSLNEKLKEQVEYYLATDNVEKFKNFNINLISLNEPFNYNLKRIPIRESMKNHEITIFIDSDTEIVNDVNFEKLLTFEDGLHAFIFKDYPKVYPYYGEVQKYSGVEEITYIFEYLFILKVKDEYKRKKFIENWDRIYQETKPTHIHSKVQVGSHVGLIIGSSCEISDIKIIDPIYSSKLEFFHSFKHLFI